AYERLRSEQLRQPREQGVGQPLYVTKALMQFDAFAEAAFNTGHIGASQDADGVFRHLPLLVKIDTAYLSSMSLSMFLDTVKVPWEAVRMHWGHTMTIPRSLAAHSLVTLSFLSTPRGGCLCPMCRNGAVTFLPCLCTSCSNSSTSLKCAGISRT